MRRLLEQLNPPQREAVTTTEGPLLVLAGAGSGKTRVITFRIAQLLHQGVAPDAVLAMTFTNKAAAEMRERVAKLVGAERAVRLTVGTFHSFCLATLRTHREAIGFPRGFTICDAQDQRATLKRVLRELHVAETTLQPAVLQSRISLLKNRMQDPDAYLAAAKSNEDELVGRAWLRYRDTLANSRRLDFDDLLTTTVRLLREHAKVLEHMRGHYRYLLVDEYQDTNAPQYEIVKAIAGKRANVCVVGDDDQSIYGWRGADVSQDPRRSRSDFPGARKTVKPRDELPLDRAGRSSAPPTG